MKKIFRYLTLCTALAWINACNTLDVEPTNSIDAETAVTDSISVARSVAGIYDGLQSGNYYGLRFLLYQDVYADNLAHSGTFTTDQEVSARQIQASNLQIANTWASIYAAINRANTVIERIDNVTLTAATRNHYIAEARFVRALCYFDLVKLFGPVPIQPRATKATGEISNVARSSENDVYNYIIEDLIFAEANLTNLNPAAQRQFRATARAATALLARVYLQRGDNVQAAAKATQAIAGSGLTTAFNAIFLNSVTNETIWTLHFSLNDQNGLAIASDPTTGGQKFYYRTAFFNAFQTSGLNGDLRFAVSARVISGRLSLVKYFRTSSSDDYVTMIRLAEMFLIRAEANARLGNPLTAPSANVLGDINVVRNRAGLANANPATNAEALTEILNQRRFEFVGEGHRYSDLLRYGLAEGLFPAGQGFRTRWPIPLTQLEVNPLLTPNPGYL
jgi:hypothetical protein